MSTLLSLVATLFFIFYLTSMRKTFICFSGKSSFSKTPIYYAVYYYGVYTNTGYGFKTFRFLPERYIVISYAESHNLADEMSSLPRRAFSYTHYSTNSVFCKMHRVVVHYMKIRTYSRIYLNPSRTVSRIY